MSEWKQYSETKGGRVKLLDRDLARERLIRDFKKRRALPAPEPRED